MATTQSDLLRISCPLRVEHRDVSQLLDPHHACHDYFPMPLYDYESPDERLFIGYTKPLLATRRDNLGMPSH